MFQVRITMHYVLHLQLLGRSYHVRSEKNCSMSLYACAECSSIELTLDYIIQQILIHNFTENEYVTQKYLKYQENIIKRTPF